MDLLKSKNRPNKKHQLISIPGEDWRFGGTKSKSQTLTADPHLGGYQEDGPTDGLIERPTDLVWVVCVCVICVVCLVL